MISLRTSDALTVKKAQGVKVGRRSTLDDRVLRRIAREREAGHRGGRDEPAVKPSITPVEFTELYIAVKDWADVISRLRSLAMRLEARGVVRSGTLTGLDAAICNTEDLLLQLGQDTEASRIEAERQMEALDIVSAADALLEQRVTPTPHGSRLPRREGGNFPVTALLSHRAKSY